MPFVLALAGSALIHLGVLLGAGWELPGLQEADPPPVEAVLVTSRPATLASAVAPATPPPPVPRTERKPPRPAPAPLPAAVAEAPQAIGSAVPPAPTFPPPRELAPDPPPAPPAPIAANPPHPLPAEGRIRYAVIRGLQGFVVGQSVHEWRHDLQGYQARSVTETTGLAALFKPARVVQTSRGTLDAQGFAPAEFRHERVNGVDGASFDRAGRQLAYAGRQEALPEGTQDMLSLYYQAALTMQPAGALDVPVATGRKLDRYRFESRGEETLALAGREWRTWHLSAKNGSDVIEMWIAPEFRVLPLKIRFIDRKGETFDQVAESIEITGYQGTSQ